MFYDIVGGRRNNSRQASSAALARSTCSRVSADCATVLQQLEEPRSVRRDVKALERYCETLFFFAIHCDSYILL